MMPEEWPIAAPAADRNAPARHAGRGRLATVRVDFFLNPADRLTEQERALMGAMLHCLVGDIADEICAELPRGWVAANDEDNAALVERLTQARLLDDAELMALLLRRADEERIATAARARSGRRDARVLQGLVSHSNGSVAAAAMALILARGRRRDRFGQCLATFDDLAPATAERLAQSVAAGFRKELASVHGSAAADSALAGATAKLLARHDPDRSIESLTASIVRLLQESGSLGDDMILAAAQEGEAAFLAEVVAQASGTHSDWALDELLSSDAQRVMALLRMSGFSRELSAGLLASIGDLLGIADPGAAIDLFERMSGDQVEAARTWLASPEAYRSAVNALGKSNG